MYAAIVLHRIYDGKQIEYPILLFVLLIKNEIILDCCAVFLSACLTFWVCLTYMRSLFSIMVKNVKVTGNSRNVTEQNSENMKKMFDSNSCVFDEKHRN